MSDDTTTREAVEREGLFEAFRARVTWFYRNAPECQEERKRSFSDQADVAFTLAMNERIDAATTAERDRIRNAVAGMKPHPLAAAFMGPEGHRIYHSALADVARIIDAEGV